MAQSFKLHQAVNAVLVKGHPDGKEAADLKTLGSQLAAAAAAT